MSQDLVKLDPPPDIPRISNEEAAEAMRLLHIDANPLALEAYKKVGSWMIQNDVPAVKLAQTFGSDAEIDYAIQVSRELADNPDPHIRAKGVNSLLSAIKTRSVVAEQALRLAEASANKGVTKGRNLPPVFSGPVSVTVNNAPEKQAISVDSVRDPK